MILTDDEELYFKCWQLVNHGRQDRDDYTTCHSLKERFTFSEWGYSLKFSDLNAALGLAQHRNRKYILDNRKLNAHWLTSRLIYSSHAFLNVPHPHRHTYMMYPVVELQLQRDKLEKAFNDNEIETRRMMPLTTQPVIRKHFGPINCDNYYPGANFLNRNGLYFGCHQDMKPADLQRIADTVEEHYDAYTN